MRQLKISQSITNRDSKSVEKYLTEIDRFHPLSSVEEIKCAQKIKGEDQKERKKYFDKLVNSNLRFVVSVAKQYHGSGVYLGDLINAGNEGLIIAAQKFDETKGFKFISYAVWWIRQSILKYIQEHTRTVRLPVSKSSKVNSYKRFEGEFMQEMNEKPSIDEIALALKIKPEEALAIVNLSEQTTFSIDKRINESEGSEETMSEFLQDNDAETNVYLNIFRDSLRKEVAEILEALTEKEKFVLVKFYNLDGLGEQTLQNIGYQIKTTSERVRQIRDKAISKLRQNKSNKKLVQYL